MEIYESKYYRIFADMNSLNINLKFNEYEFINLPSVEYELSKRFDVPMYNTESSIREMMGVLDSLFNDMESRGSIKPKLIHTLTTIDGDIDGTKIKKEKFEGYRAKLVRAVTEDFGIDNPHDIKYVVNKLTNLYSKYKSVFAVRVCYSDENKSQDRLYSYINKYESGFDNHEELLYNEVTGKYILLGLSFRTYDN